MKQQKRGSFTSNFGVMMAVAGSAVGLGNIWRFPFLVGENGGAAFLILYLSLIVILGLPLILSEFMIGKIAQRGAVGSFKVLAPKTKWYLVGYMGVITGFTILGFYSVIAGWTVKFLFDAVGNSFAGHNSTEIAQSFSCFVNSGWQPILYAVIFIAATAWIVMKGVEKGVEKYNKILMPVLVVILLVLAVNSMTLDGFGKGMDFLFNPDFSKITGKTFLDALGQVFFTLSVAMGILITYGSYVKNEDNIVKTQCSVAVIDTFIAIVSGIVIFPAVFTYGVEPSQGPSLVFITLPNIFAQMPGGYIVGIMFFILLFIAAITSAISLMEVVVAFLTEEYKLTRKRAIIYISLGVLVLATLSALSQMDGSSLVLFGYDVFDLLDKMTSNIFMTVGGFAIAIFTGWVMRKDQLRAVITSNGKHLNWLFPIFLFSVRYICPIAVAVIFLSKIGLI